MGETSDQSQFIDELLDQQDAVIAQLDELLEKIEAVLKVAVVAQAVDEPAVAAPAEIQRHAA